MKNITCFLICAMLSLCAFSGCTKTTDSPSTIGDIELNAETLAGTWETSKVYESERGEFFSKVAYTFDTSGKFAHTRKSGYINDGTAVAEIDYRVSGKYTIIDNVIIMKVQNVEYDTEYGYADDEYTLEVLVYTKDRMIANRYMMEETISLYRVAE